MWRGEGRRGEGREEGKVRGRGGRRRRERWWWFCGRVPVDTTPGNVPVYRA